MSKPKKIDNSIGQEKVSRDENGLLENIQYIFNEDGFVDWRAMINDEHLYPNKGWFERCDKEVPDSVEGLKDHQLLIKLSGIKELLKLRGYKSVSFTVIEASYDRAVVKCQVKFTPNYETNHNSIDFTEVANATSNNCDGFSVKFYANRMCLSYQSDVLLKDVYANNFAGEIDRQMNEIKKFLQKEYHSFTLAV